MKAKFKKGDRVEYTWPNFGNPTTEQGTVINAHRDGSLTIKWDHQERKMWRISPQLLKKLE